MVDILSRVTTHLDPDMVRLILNEVTLGDAHWVEVHNPTIIEGEHGLEQGLCVTASCALVQMHVTD